MAGVVQCYDCGEEEGYSSSCQDANDVMGETGYQTGEDGWTRCPDCHKEHLKEHGIDSEE